MSAVLSDAIKRIDAECRCHHAWDDEWDHGWDQSGGSNWHKYWNDSSGW